MTDEKLGQRSNILIKVGGLLGAIAVVTTALSTIVTDGSTILEKTPFRKMTGTTGSSGGDSSSFENKTLMIMETRGGKCIDVVGSPGQHNGDRLQLWNCELSGTNIDNNVRTDQRWKITSDGYIRNELSEKCIDVDGSPTNDGVGLVLGDCELSPKFKLEGY